MLIAFAFSFIGVLLVYANYKPLRHNKFLIIAWFVTLLLAASGIYLITSMDLENPYYMMALISPLMALSFLQLARWLFRKIGNQEIILYLGGFIPKRFEERYVTRMEKVLTFLISTLSLLLAFLVVMVIVQGE
jgi:hypothetical protein